MQQQAFRHVPCADAGRIERLQQRQGRPQFVQVRLHFGRQPAQDFFQRRPQVAVFVQFVDQQPRQRNVTGLRPGQDQLAQEVFAQRVRAGRLGQGGILVRIDAAGPRHFLGRRLALERGVVVLHGGLAFGIRLRVGRR
ncbi:hypothetical protein D9M68_714210 [compost metagenome]